MLLLREETSAMLYGIDLGGTKIEGVVLDPTRGLQTVVRRRVDTQQANGYAHILDSISSLVRVLEKDSGGRATSVGIGTPGVLDETTKSIRGSNTLCLNGRPLRDDLQAQLGVPVLIENDANCFALAEDQLGAAKGSRMTFGIIMGTGVGGGLIIDGKIWRGKQGIAGEWGHNVLEQGGMKCYCGKSGCVETVLSGPALLHDYANRSGRNESRFETVVDLAESGDAAAAETMARLIHWFGAALSTLINVLDPDCIVLGGGVSNVVRLYTDGIAHARRGVFNPNPEAKIVKNILGDSAGVLGAAMLAARLK